MSLEPIISRLSKSIWVVLYKTRPSPRYPRGQLTLLTDPGEDKPWSTHNQMLAKHHADLNKGQAATWGEAYSLLLKEYGSPQQLEAELIERAREQQEASQKLQSRATDTPGVSADGFNDNVNRN